MRIAKDGDVYKFEFDSAVESESNAIANIFSQMGINLQNSEKIVGGLDHEWDNYRLRIKSADGTWGDWVNLKGEPGEMGFDGRNGTDAWDGSDGVDAGIPEHEWSGSKLRFRQPNGDWGEFADLSKLLNIQPPTAIPSSLSPQHTLYERTKVGQWQYAKLLNHCQGYLFYRTMGEKLLNLRGSIKLTKDLWANAPIAEISDDKAKPINYGIEGEKLIKIPIMVTVLDNLVIADFNSKGILSMRSRTLANQQILIHAVIGR